MTYLAKSWRSRGDIFGRFECTYDGVFDEELFLEIVANLLGGHNEGGKPIDGKTRQAILAQARRLGNSRSRMQ